MRWRTLRPIVGILGVLLTLAIASVPAPPPAPQEVVVGQEGSVLSIVPGSAGEGAAGVPVGFARSGPTDTTVTFRVETPPGPSAELGVDYLGISAPLTIIPGSGGVGIQIPIVHDTVDEDDETFQVQAIDVAGATPTQLVETFTILDDDPSPSISIGPGTTVDEGAGTVQVPLELSTVSGRAVSVLASTVAGSASAGSDFTALSGTLVQVPPGETTATVGVPILDDALDEPQEQLTVQLSTPTNVTLGTDTATITIADDDLPPPPGSSTTTTRFRLPTTTTTRPPSTTTIVARTAPTTAPPTTTAPPATRAPADEERVRPPDAADDDERVAPDREPGDDQVALGPEAGRPPPGSFDGGGDGPAGGDPAASGRDAGDRDGSGSRSRTDVAQSDLVASVARPQDLDLTPGSLATSVAAAGGLLGLIAYSSELFDSTFEANERRIRRALRWLPGKGEAPRHRALGIVACVLAGGAIFTALSDDLALDLTTAMLFAGMTIAVAATSFGVVVADVAFVRRRFGVRGVMQAVPTGLLIGAAGVLLSKLIGFHPGYAYGVVAGWAFTARLSDREEGHLAALTTVNLLAVALAAWVLRAPLQASAGGDDPAALAVAADAALTGIFLLCLDSGIVGLIPIRFLRGRSILHWSTAAWAALTFVAVTIFVLLVLQPSGSRVLGSDGLGAHVLVLCVGFAGASGAFWAWFRFVPDPHPELDEPAAWVPRELPG